MFTVNEYKMVFKRRWHQTRLQAEDYGSGYIIPDGDGRYDTVCEIWISGLEVPRFTGVAKLHPNDQPDKIVGKKIALRNAIIDRGAYNNWAFQDKSIRSAIWKAFWAWVATWAKKSKIDVRQIVTKYLKDNGFDGLYAEECGCQISDLFPCDGPCDDCKPGYKVPCDPKTCQAYGDCEWHIGPKQLHTYEEETNKTKGGG